jgi:hypothetical protein
MLVLELLVYHNLELLFFEKDRAVARNDVDFIFSLFLFLLLLLLELEILILTLVVWAIVDGRLKGNVLISPKELVYSWRES